MFDSETLEAAIGMAFLFMLMALLCTAAKEWLEGVLKWRAMDLERAVRTLLDDADGSLTAHVYRHPLISSLFQGTYRPQDLTSSALTPGRGAQHMRLSERRNLPSYIPSGHFANALIDLVARGPVDATTADATMPLTVAVLRQRAALLASPHLQRALLTAIDHSGDDLERLRANLQAWFDGTMDRATGWYKRRTQAVLFMFGLGAAVLMNVDALHVLQRLTVDKALRDVVVKQAEAAKAPEAPASSTDERSKQAREQFEQTRGRIEAIGLPIGWRDDEDGRPIPRQLCTNPNEDPCKCVADPKQARLRAGVGWLITALAVMLGAPFWFDVLSKLMTVRATKKPEEAVADKARDATPAASATPPAAPAAPSAQPAPFEPHEWRDGFDNPQQVTL